MTKLSTLETVRSQASIKRNQSGNKTLIPSGEAVKMLLRYSMALQVLKSEVSGDHLLILN